jgi:large subunit ribosomal protein L6
MLVGKFYVRLFKTEIKKKSTMSFRDSRQIKIPSGVKISIEAFDRNGSQLCVSGPKGSLTLQIPEGLQIVEEPEQNLLRVETQVNLKKVKAHIGSISKHVSRALKGVFQGFQVQLNLIGVGYRASVKENTLVLRLGYSHEIEIPFDQENIDILVPKPNIILLKGSHYGSLKRLAADIRSWRLPEPYKGKGIFYKDEVIRRKVGKKN